MTDGSVKEKQQQSDNPFVEPAQNQAAVNMQDVMVLNEIIEQAGRPCSASIPAGELKSKKKKIIS